MQVALFVFQLGRRRWEARQVSGVRGWGVTREAGPWRAGLGRDARGRGARRVGDAGRWFVSGVRCGFGAAVRVRSRGGLGRDDGLALVWRWFGGISETVTS